MTEATTPFALRRISSAGLVEALETITQIVDTLQPPMNEPDSLPISQIVQVPALFQARGPHIDERHARLLLDLLKRGGRLDPLLVWRCGESAILLDGHHRLHAYRRFLSGEQAKDVPVVWHRGGLEEAVAAAAVANSEIKLQMDTRQRTNLGWRLVLMGRHTKKEIAKLSGISERSVSNMRAAMKVLVEAGTDRADLPETWCQALRDARGVDSDKDHLDYEDFADIQAQQWADKLAKTFSTRLARSPVIAAKALDIYLGQMAQEVGRLLLVEAGDPLADQIEDMMLDDLPF